MAKSRKAEFTDISGTSPSLIKNPANPSVRDWEQVYKEILKRAIACEKSNPDFFWAASDMVVPQLEIKTILYGQPNGGFRALTESKGELGRAARKFAQAMDLSFQKGGKDMPENICSDIAHLLAHYKMGEVANKPYPAKTREYVAV